MRLTSSSDILFPNSRSNAATIAFTKNSVTYAGRAIVPRSFSLPLQVAKWGVTTKPSSLLLLMDWLKKKKDEAKHAASQAAAKIQNKRTPAFKGEGNVLGGGSGDAPVPAAAAPAATSRSFKIPTFGKPAAPPPLTEEEQKARREAQLKALESRTNAWDKRVNNARKARMQQEAELEAKYELPPPPPPTTSSSSSPLRSGPSPRVLSAEEMKAFEIQNAQAQVGFNPYAATFSSSTEASTVMNSISSGTAPPAAPSRDSPAPLAVASSFPAIPPAGSPSMDIEPNGRGAVYVLLRQDPSRAIAAAETIIKMLNNIQNNPTEEKYRKVRLSNASIQSKLVAVNGAVEILEEAGFSKIAVDGEEYLMLTDEAYLVDRVQSAIDRTEVALIQLQIDSSSA
ncbi:putative ubiquitin regulatory protein, partial [Globisporangium splendens]